MAACFVRPFLLLTVVDGCDLLIRVKALGSLEERMMAVLWAGDPMMVREVRAKLNDEPAYTTVMTTLDRLYKKGLLSRERDGTAFVYRPAMTRDQFHRSLVENTVGGLLEKSAGPVLAAFVDTAAELDENNLRKLEELIAEHRRNKG